MSKMPIDKPSPSEIFAMKLIKAMEPIHTATFKIVRWQIDGDPVTTIGRDCFRPARGGNALERTNENQLFMVGLLSS